MHASHNSSANHNQLAKHVSLPPQFSIANDAFKGAAYRKVAEAVAGFPAPVRSGKALASGKGKVAGIGKASGEKIDEWLTSGKVRRDG